MSDLAARVFKLGVSLNRQRAKDLLPQHGGELLRAVAQDTIGVHRFRQAVDTVTERLDVLVALAASEDYPIERIDVRDRAEQIVLAVIAQLKAKA